MKTVKKVGLVLAAFHYGGLHQLEQEWVWGTAAGIGLMQGLKYNGSLKRGVTGGAAVIGTMYVLNGLNNVFGYRRNIKNAFTKEE